MSSPRVGELLSRLLFYAVFAGAFGAISITAVAAQNAVPAGHRNIPPEAGPNRPATVPSGYVITPFGYFAPSCVQSLAIGDRLLKDGRVEHADGTIEGYVAVCDYPHYNRLGIMMKTTPTSPTGPAESSAPSVTSPQFNGWLELASVTTTTSFGSLAATWTVPPDPPVNDGQVLFFFPGLEDFSNVQTILQPVLAWYPGHWSIASWNCCLYGVISTSPGVDVSAGDRIYGSMTNDCAPGTSSCPYWNVLTVDLSTGQSTTLSNTPSIGQTFSWAFGGVAEVYYINRCEDYPADRMIQFRRVTLLDNNLQPIKTPHWNPTNNSSTPQCSYGIKAENRDITLQY